ncbi:PREDICTED: neuroglian-like isoform X2 [Priapulus caudatus]|uniref:Neuroglian-like isoform X2 n=1 Tax=Priapulus caudatus TaxID=37621 RepID=A0ABM1E5G8_PRICU|nr:PREDICTED: neuroglian-like isoform X2 [Priapulus caudatus]
METEEEYMEDHIVVAPLTPGTKYEMKVVAGNGDTDDLKTESVPQEVITEGDDSIATAGWFIGMMIAIAILILILIIVCLIKRNRGGKYPVQEKEAALGKDPEKGDEDGGFPEYNKPLTAEPDDTKGSRPSLNSLVKPMGSETDSMAEYGDGEGGKFNEDGSFIGLYGGEKKPRQAAGDQPAEQPSALSTFV